MARYQRFDTIEQLFHASDTWLKLSLTEGQSVFKNCTLWTTKNIEMLETWFTNNPDTGGGNFFEKLEVQLAECEPEVKQLAAEMLWLMLICPKNIGAAKKRESVMRVWGWSGEELDENHALLSDSTFAGVGNAGTSFNTNRWRELAYCIEICKRAFSINVQERIELFSDYDELVIWLATTPESERRQFRHMLLYMLHPDKIERIFSSGERKDIVCHFMSKPKKIVNKLSAAEIDKKILNIRKEKEAEFGDKTLDFYLSPLKEFWKTPSNRSWLFNWNPNEWKWEMLDEDLAQIHSGKPVVIKWCCTNQSISPGDRAWLMRVSEESCGIIATGNIVSKPFEDKHPNKERSQQGETCLFVKIEITDIGDVKSPFIMLKELVTLVNDDPPWLSQSSEIEIKPHTADMLDTLWQQRLLKTTDMAVQTIKNCQQVEPTNKIWYGPPGTGKTFVLNQLKEKYTVKQAAVPYKTWLLEQLKPISWFDVVFMCLFDLGKPAKVKEIASHPFFVNKAKAVGRHQNLKAQIWSTLQSHTVETSTSVNYKVRIAPLVFDKDAESHWQLAENWKEDGEDLIEQAEQLKRGAPKQSDQIHYDFVTFHQAYSYEDFVEGIRPVQDSETDQMIYRVEPGVFRQLCQDARNDPQTHYALFIDEINRGNIAKIFGELITLIEPDKRAVYDEKGKLKLGMELTLPYSRELFSVPKNLDVYGTMNTADRSIALLDTALRRRFQFEELMPDAKLISGVHGDGFIDDGEGGQIDLRSLLDTMNKRIRFLLSRDMTLGHGYLCPVKDFESLRVVVLNQLIPLLQEYFYNDWHRIQLVFADVDANHKCVDEPIIRSQTVSSSEVLGFEHDDFEEQIVYSVVEPESITPDSIRKIYETQE